MSALTHHHNPSPPIEDLSWQPEVTQLLNEHHLAAWSADPQYRLRFASSLTRFLETLHETEVFTFYGSHITDLESFCHQLERAMPGPPLQRRLDGPQGITALLRARQSFPGRTASKHRYFIWHDADTLLRTNHRLFGRLVDALAGVAAESEFANDDLLLVHRTVFVGGPLLDVYADNPSGQFRAWVHDGPHEPAWQTIAGLPRPPFLRFHIDRLSAQPAEQQRPSA